MQRLRKKIFITGLTQGVGFRPTVYRYATEHNLSGFVSNTPQGVLIEVEGQVSLILSFIQKLKTSPPPLAKLDELTVEDISPKNQQNIFNIVSSNTEGTKNSVISADISICADCLNDINDATNHRYNFPFTNCTNCGPRFSIINDRPYDRHLTSMSSFQMCPTCLEEYHDPMNRRFHAQPNACPNCGPSLTLLEKDERISLDVINQTINKLKAGKIIAVKGLGGFNIMCDPSIPKTLQKLRRVKKRPSKSFALMMRDIETVKRYCNVNKLEQNQLKSFASPIVLLKQKNEKYKNVSPDNSFYGVMLPYTPLHHIIIKEFEALIMTSANKADEPIAINDTDVQMLLDDNIIDMALTNDRQIVHRCDDSIVQVCNSNVQIIRRSRGFVPSPIKLKNDLQSDQQVLAFGANLKNTFALRKNNDIFISQHIGDMVEYKNFEYQQSQIDDFQNLLEINPDQVCCDAHPGYENFNEKYHLVYHHHAHMLSVMGEHGLLGTDVLGVICDGTGLGTDGNIWGFEFLQCSSNYKKFLRKGHLKYFMLPGGEKAITEIDRIAVSLTHSLEPDSLLEVSETRVEQIKSLINSKINCPLTSSLGRLFDGVASILNMLKAHNCEYEAKAAMVLQANAENFKGVVKEYYQVKICKDKGIYIIDHSALIQQIIEDKKNSVPKEEIAYKFHFWVVNAILDMIELINPTKVVFSGGCFQNKLIMTILHESLESCSFKDRCCFYFNELVPCNDAGISFGQALAIQGE